MELNKIHNKDCLEGLKELPDESVDCCVTSPPYWALRDYGVEGQLGLEPTFDEYISKLCDIFDEVKRVLKKEGTCWINLGDTYHNATKWTNKNELPQTISGGDNRSFNASKRENQNIPEKCLCQIPSRFAIEMTNRGWILRNTIIWHKPSCMPASVTDRFTVDFEYLFFFVKNKKYWFETQYEPAHFPNQGKWTQGDNKGYHNNQDMPARKLHEYVKGDSRNKRTVWTINPKPFAEAHFAVFPEELIEIPIKAGCPEFVCKKCGKGREKIIESEVTFHSGSGKSGIKPKGKHENQQESNSGSYDIRMGPKIVKKEMGLTDCGCNAEFENGIVLDPFGGSGTTMLVALKQNKKSILYELNPDYIKIAEKRVRGWKEQKRLGEY